MSRRAAVAALLLPLISCAASPSVVARSSGAREDRDAGVVQDDRARAVGGGYTPEESAPIHSTLATGTLWSCALDRHGALSCWGYVAPRARSALIEAPPRRLRAIAGRADLLCALDEAGCVRCGAMLWPRFDFEAQMAAPLCGVDALAVGSATIVASQAGRRMCSRLIETGYDWQPCDRSQTDSAIVVTDPALHCRQPDFACRWSDPLPQSVWWTRTHAPEERLSALLRRECATGGCSTFAPLHQDWACLAQGSRVDCFRWSEERWDREFTVEDVVESAASEWHLCVRRRDQRVYCLGNPQWGRVDRTSCGEADRAPFRLMAGPVRDFAASNLAVCALVDEGDTRVLRCAGDPSRGAIADLNASVWSTPRFVRRSATANRVFVAENAIRIIDSSTGVISLYFEPAGIGVDRHAIAPTMVAVSSEMVCLDLRGGISCSPVGQFGGWGPVARAQRVPSALRDIAAGLSTACFASEHDRVSCFDLWNERRRWRHMVGSGVVAGGLSVAVQRRDSVHVMQEQDFPTRAVVVPTSLIADFRLHATYFGEVCGSDASGQLWCGQRALRPVAGAMVDRQAPRVAAMSGSFRCWVNPTHELWCAGHSELCAINERDVERTFVEVAMP